MKYLGKNITGYTFEDNCKTLIKELQEQRNANIIHVQGRQTHDVISFENLISVFGRVY